MIISRSREEVKALVQTGELNIKSLYHYDVCKALEEGKSTFDVAQMFNTDDRHIRYIRKCKCPELRPG